MQHLGYGLYQQQTQKLMMTPELRQAITILQFPAIELANYIHEQMLENPVLDAKEKEKDMERFDYLYKNNRSYSKQASIDDDEWNIWDTIAAPEKTLEEHLLQQARLLNLTSRDYNILKFLIGNLNDDGYFQLSLFDVTKHFNASELEIEKMLKLLQTLDPIGVGARSLQEALIIQLEQVSPVDEKAICLVKDHLQELAEWKVAKIAKSLEITVQEVQLLADYIKTLKPKPAMGFSTGHPKYIVPDITVEKIDGEWIIIVNDALVPRLHLNAHYYQYVQENNKQDDASKYIIDKWNQASWLIKSIEQRRLTLLKVTRAIIEYQEQFFVNGTLKPLTLKEIAEVVDVHESTVSRAVNQKYVQTPLGIFEFKFFFGSGFSNQAGDTTSSENVKQTIKELIMEEDKRKPLSDQKIANLLEEKGITISRRTVAKYRDELGIDPSSKRKRFD